MTKQTAHYTKRTEYDLDWEYIKRHKDMLRLEEELSFNLKDGREYVLQVAAINPDGDGGIVLISKDIRDWGEMNKIPPNRGGWEVSEMRRYLNYEFINLLPDSLVKIIQPRTLPDCGCLDHLWLPSYMEVYGKPVDETDSGQQFELFAKDRNLYKTRADGVADGWWLRSPNIAPAVFWRVRSDSTNVAVYATSSCGIVWCIMI